ncbi:MAG: DNA repair protein RadA [Candidatus Dasytiphilus stammeri]
MKDKNLFICKKCQTTYPRWKGQCNSCQQWNSIIDIPFTKGSHNKNKLLDDYLLKIQLLSVITLEEVTRFSTGFKEFDRVLGGGIVSGSTILIGGNPGTGKSTLLLQTLCNLSNQMKAIYVTGEESLNQVALRAHRLNLLKFNVYMLAATSIEQICLIAEQEKPSVMVIDSIQVMQISTVKSSPGSVAQVREVAAYLTQFAKKNLITIIIVGHVTKDGILAGPKVLEHCIDCSLLLDGTTTESNFRILRSHKNRFGAINELGIFCMTEEGLHEVNNPSALFINRRDKITTGSAIMAIWEGTRPLLVEIQVLVNQALIMGHPKRVVVGLEYNRLTILLAVLHRHGGLQINNLDIFVNVVGGVKVTETSVDLALLLAIVSSLRNIPIPIDIVIFGEVGLSGEIRPVPSAHGRVIEAAKHGFCRAIVPTENLPKNPIDNITVFGVKTIIEALLLLAKFWGISN